MYKHKATHRESVITVVDDDGKHHIFTPGKIITLNRVYPELEKNGIICMNPDEKKITIKKKKQTESEL